MRDLPCTRLEMDEIWGYVGKKENHRRQGDNPKFGNVWTWCVIDADTKLVPTFKVGARNRATAREFVKDVANRMKYCVQISTDGLNDYVAAIDDFFGANASYGQIIRTYGHHVCAALPNADAKPHDRIAVNTSHALNGPDRRSFRQCADYRDLLVCVENVRHKASPR